MTAEESEDHRANTLAFLSRKRNSTNEGPVAEAKRAKGAPKQERKATYEWLLALQNALVAGTGQGLEAFLPKGPAREWDEDIADEAERDDEPCLTLVMDQSQKQWTGGYYLQRCLNLRVEFIIPPSIADTTTSWQGSLGVGSFPSWSRQSSSTTSLTDLSARGAT